MKTQIPKQALVFVEQWTSVGATPKALPLSVADEPKRIWTLFQHVEKSEPPTLPFVPQHNLNAFLEDKTHDWNWKNGVLRYYSRVAGSPVWLLLEY